jgi:hypothetical protein
VIFMELIGDFYDLSELTGDCYDLLKLIGDTVVMIW